MAFTRFHDDADRQIKYLEESTFQGIYHLNTPGNGLKNPYVDDVHIRLQKWGANLHSHSCNIESNLRGMNIPLEKDNTSYKSVEPYHSKVNYPVNKQFLIDETRASDPAWKYREKEQSKKSILFNDPQKNVFIPFKHNLHTRILEKDYYTKNKK